MCEALDNLRSISQRDDKFWEAYPESFNIPIHRWENIHEEVENMAFYIDGFSKNIQIKVPRHRESIFKSELNFKDLIHFARSEDGTVRAWARWSNTSPYYNRLYFKSTTLRGM